MYDDGRNTVKGEVEIGHVDTTHIKVGRMDCQVRCRVIAAVCNTLRSFKKKRPTPTCLVAYGEESLFWE